MKVHNKSDYELAKEELKEIYETEGASFNYWEAFFEIRDMEELGAKYYE